MDYNNKFRSAKNFNDNKYKENSKKRFIKILEKKFQTTMIGALAKFEERFGEMWGHGLDYDELNNVEKKYSEIWEMVRTDILNNGNAQLRAMINELEQYDLHWNRYKTEFIIRKVGE